ncbi:winged helix-turn-helix domain-containing protein [Actinokineospora sp. NBRC 105648]|uniref:ArsR/SmtB family transcription factor n=1 Tax=Actinokineospora sp. NBRC 105648 TaxID=3032206 RepID=UPI0024A2328A|nr:winged helix-turn-helix domain-containing protein [Actinokineospora sp. NBRC 105648]GLZ36648.1 transcriptional regulator [Actinokineospora sp. NBRC 105648]
MLRIHFTAADLARLRMVASLGPVAESVFGLDVYGRAGTVGFHAWRKNVRALLRGSPAWECPPLDELLWLLERPVGARGQGAGGDPIREQVTATVYEFCRLAVMPHWERVRTHLEAVRDSLGRVAITSGVEGLLGALHPKVNWVAPVLEIPDAADRDIHLRGRGLSLSPSVFLSGRTAVVVRSERATGVPAMVFGVPATSDLWRVDEPNEQALEALVGHTRAAALRALTESCTTSELSQRLGISLAGASKHATVLRKAGLVMTARNRNSVTHSLTGLGVALLKSREPVRSRHPEVV